jgi:CRISPR-associated endonuclease/helicase Cas3
MTELSLTAKSLWAKKARNGSSLWLPLFVHMSDSVGVAKKLWKYWVADGVKVVIQNDVGINDAVKLFVFLAASHDIGKATPVFQAKQVKYDSSELDKKMQIKLINAGLPIKSTRDFIDADKTPHALATQMILEQKGKEENVKLRNTAVILGAHHGKPPSSEILNQRGINVYGMNFHLGKEGKQAWTEVQKELIRFALALAGYSTVGEIPQPKLVSQILLSGLLVMTDWIASNEHYFPYIDVTDELIVVNQESRLERGWKKLHLPAPWRISEEWKDEDLFRKRFSIDSSGFPNLTQTIIQNTAAEIDEPGILVLEAPMGSGKTEAALAAAEIFAGKVNRNGIFFALPTQATSNGIFTRINDWVSRLGGLHTIELAHGKAQFNTDFTSLHYLNGSANIGIDDLESGGVIHQWFEGQKKSLLADFVVGTIDQLLLAALKQKHLMLRHLGLANKVVIIDECHAYDAYMSRYLEMALRWLGAYRVPVIVLSATLPAQKRKMVIEAYLNDRLESEQRTGSETESINERDQNPAWAVRRGYPLITYTSGYQVLQKTIPTDNQSTEVNLGFIENDEIVQILDELLSEGGCAGVIVNTVGRAQKLACELRKHFGDDVVHLLHSRFLIPDRFQKEKALKHELGKPGPHTSRPYKRIVVGTQVLEQSLDIDFDVMITDICPMDLLLQRIGRLHRHERNRPQKVNKALCFITSVDGNDYDAGTKFIYGEFILMRTKALLPPSLCLPRDIPNLVQDVYSYDIAISPEPVGYHEAKEKWEKVIEDKEKRAIDFRITPPWDNPRANMVDWLNTDVSDQQGEAAVRDTDESIEVLILQERNSKLYFLPWMEEGRELPMDKLLNNETAKALARQRLQLPRALCQPWTISQTLAELKQVNEDRLGKWQHSTWLKGELVLILDEDQEGQLSGYRLKYDRDYGLTYEKEGEKNA